jgi:DNA-binding NarL/FixJ family response regulator
MAKTKIALIDDDVVLSTFTKNLLDRQPDMECMLTAEQVNVLLDHLKSGSNCPDVILLDIMLGDSNSLESIRQIRRLAPNVKIIIFTGQSEHEMVHTAVQNKIDGYFIKGDSPEGLPDIIRKTTEGGSYISPKAANIVLNVLAENNNAANRLDLIRKKLQWMAPYRAVLVIDGLLEGKSYQEIANSMNLSLDGVGYYIRLIYQKLGIHKRSELIRMFDE